MMTRKAEIVESPSPTDRSLEVTVEELAPRVLRYCRGRLTTALSEGVAQEALMALVRRWRRYGSPDDPAAFVFAIARRRAARARLRERLQEPLDAVRGRAAPGLDPEEHSLDRERRRALVLALERLPRREREALLLVAAWQLDQKSAAALVGTTTAAFKMRLHRGRKRLLGLLEVQHEPA